MKKSMLLLLLLLNGCAISKDSGISGNGGSPRYSLNTNIPTLPYTVTSKYKVNNYVDTEWDSIEFIDTEWDSTDFIDTEWDSTDFIDAEWDSTDFIDAEWNSSEFIGTDLELLDDEFI